MKKLLIILPVIVIAAIGWRVSRAKLQVNVPAIGVLTKQTNKTPSVPKFNKRQYSIDDPASIWIVVNKDRPLNPLSFTPTDLVVVGNGQRMRSIAATALQSLFAAAKAAGYTLTAESGYRSYTTQVAVYNGEVKAFGQAKADSESARPGHSEHQTGWAVDLGTPGCYEDCFGTTAAATWLVAQAHNYGFLRRYPAGKEAVTGYRNEAWHFRFIGIDLATEMHKEGILTLEEFFNLPAAPNYP